MVDLKRAEEEERERRGCTGISLRFGGFPDCITPGR